MPKVTVLTATYNGESFIEETVQSIRAQTFKDWEYIIVDDGSTDSTPELLDRFCAADVRIKVIRRENAGGPYVAGNAGLQAASGEYIAITDHDDLSLPGRIEAQLAFLDAHRDLRACTTNIRTLIDGKVRMQGYRPVPTSSKVLKWCLCLRPALCHSSLCIAREAMEAIGGYREESLTNEDYRLFCTLARLDWIGVVPEFHVHLRAHSQSVTQSRPRESMRNDILVVGEHIKELTGEKWEEEDVFALNTRTSAAPIKAVLSALRRWDDAWMSDLNLGPADVCELRELSAGQRRAALRSRSRRQPWAFLMHIKEYINPEP